MSQNVAFKRKKWVNFGAMARPVLWHARVSRARKTKSPAGIAGLCNCDGPPFRIGVCVRRRQEAQDSRNNNRLFAPGPYRKKTSLAPAKLVFGL
jgi:hypothetical protein